MWKDVSTVEDKTFNELFLSTNCDLKPLDALIIEATFDYIHSDDAATGELLFKQAIDQARFRWQLSRRLSQRLVVQHNSSPSPSWQQVAHQEVQTAQPGDPQHWYNMSFGSKWVIDPLVTYCFNSFSVVYVGSTHDFRDFNASYEDASARHLMTSRQYFMKLQ